MIPIFTILWLLWFSVLYTIPGCAFGLAIFYLLVKFNVVLNNADGRKLLVNLLTKIISASLNIIVWGFQALIVGGSISWTILRNPDSTKWLLYIIGIIGAIPWIFLQNNSRFKTIDETKTKGFITFTNLLFYFIGILYVFKLPDWIQAFSRWLSTGKPAFSLSIQITIALFVYLLLIYTMVSMKGLLRGSVVFIDAIVSKLEAMHNQIPVQAASGPNDDQQGPDNNEANPSS